MKTSKLMIGFTALFLAACGTRHPLGIAEDQWQAMSTEQRLQAQEKQADLDRAADERRTVEARAREAEAARKQAELESQRRNARYGERLQCVLNDAEAQLFGKWRPIQPLALDLVKGANITLELVDASGHAVRYRTVAHAAFDGQTLSLCRDADDERRNLNFCLRVLGTFAGFQRGIHRRVDAERFLRGHLRCDLAPGPGMPAQIIINR
jgi:hypothetical protein